MQVNIKKYLVTEYPKPPCWALVSDFYVNEFKFDLSSIIEVEPPTTIETIQVAFLCSILKDKMFSFQDSQKQGAIVLMYKNFKDRPDHCGIYLNGRVLHALKTMPVYEEFHNVKSGYDQIKYGVLNDY